MKIMRIVLVGFALMVADRVFALGEWDFGGRAMSPPTSTILALSDSFLREFGAASYAHTWQNNWSIDMALGMDLYFQSFFEITAGYEPLIPRFGRWGVFMGSRTSYNARSLVWQAVPVFGVSADIFMKRIVMGVRITTPYLINEYGKSPLSPLEHLDPRLEVSMGYRFPDRR